MQWFHRCFIQVFPPESLVGMVQLQYLKSRWPSPYILVYKNPLLTTYLLVSVPSILTLRYIDLDFFNMVFCHRLASWDLVGVLFLKINRTGFPSAAIPEFPAVISCAHWDSGWMCRFGAALRSFQRIQERRKTTFSFKTSLIFSRFQVSETMIELYMIWNYIYVQIDHGLLSSLFFFRCIKWFSWSTYGGFLKWRYPTTMGFPTKNDHFGVFGGYHY